MLIITVLIQVPVSGRYSRQRSPGKGVQNCPDDSDDITTITMTVLTLSSALDFMLKMKGYMEPFGLCGAEMLPDLILRKFLEAKSWARL